MSRFHFLALPKLNTDPVFHGSQKECETQKLARAKGQRKKERKRVITSLKKGNGTKGQRLVYPKFFSSLGDRYSDIDVGSQ